MSVGARPGITLSEIEREFVRLTGLGPFAFPCWYAEQMRALRAWMEASCGQWPAYRAEQEKALLEVLRATPERPT